MIQAMRDLGLGYEEALHGVQSAVRFEMTQRGIPDDEVSSGIQMMKHLRVGLDMRAADTHALITLLINKGILTAEEYIEHIRLAANEELARYQEHIKNTYGIEADFR